MSTKLLGFFEEAHILGSIPKEINATFISIISKKITPHSFVDSHLISLCNYLYKMMSKLISHRLKGVMSKYMTPEQFAFLDDMLIEDAIGITQELTHFI